MRRTNPLRGCLIAFIGMVLAAVLSCGMCMLVVFFAPLPAYNVLVLGLDSRGAEGAVARSDSIMVVGVPSASSQLGLLSIPRDLFLPVPGYGQQRVNTINVLGEMEQPGRGLTLAAESIGGAFNVPIDRVVRLDFNAFVAIVDALGGVNVYVERTFTDFQYPTDDFNTEQVTFTEGWTTMDGATALKYARTRSMDDDYARAGRQQAVFRAVAVRLINPLTWPAVLLAWQNNVTTDLTLRDMLILGPSVVLRAGQIDQLVIDRGYIVPGSQGAVPDYERLAPFVQQYFGRR